MEPILMKTIKYKLPITRKTIEIPEKARNKAIAVACVSTLEAGAGAVFTLGGIAAKEPMFTGVGLAILGKVAGGIAMLKGSIWDFAGNFAKNQKDLLNLKKSLEKAGKQIDSKYYV